MFISYIICLSFYPSHTLSFSHCYIYTYTSSISTSSSSSSSVGTCRYGLSGAGWNLYPVMTKNTRVASSLNNSSSHSYWKGTVIYKDIGRVQLSTKTMNKTCSQIMCSLHMIYLEFRFNYYPFYIH